jgi:TldD protein
VIDLEELRRALAAAAHPRDELADAFAERRVTLYCLVRDGAREVSVRSQEGIAVRGHSPAGSWLRHEPGLQEWGAAGGLSPELLEAAAGAASEAAEAAASGGTGSRVSVSLTEQEVGIARSDGLTHHETRRWAHLRVEAVARSGRRVRAVRRAITASDLTGLRAAGAHRRVGATAAEAALLRLEAVAAPTGEMPVVLGPGMPATLLHEACGHLLEGDVAGRPGSAFYDRAGTRVGSPLLTIVDEPSPHGEVGHYLVDDEGEQGRRVTLVEEGVLRDLLLDRVTATRLGLSPNGHGRRSGYQHAPLPRMAATFLLPGPSSAEEIVRETAHGLYVASMHGGDADLGGRFHLNVDEGFLIEGGRLTAPVRGAIVSGYGPRVLECVDRVAGDLGLAMHSSACSKLDATPLSVSLGQPTIRVAALEVWGG